MNYDLIIAIAGSILVASALSAQQPPAVTIEDSHALILDSEHTGQSYAVQILLPPSYDETDKHYPVLYTLDGQWDFRLLAGMVGGMAYDALLPDVIVVGITYATPPEDLGAWRFGHFVPEEGSDVGADRFLACLKDELIPFVESRYRAAPDDRTLLGSSLAGFFVLYALFHETALFHRYVSSSPSLWWVQQIAFTYEADYAAQHDDLPVRLSLTVGAEESDDMIETRQRLSDLLQQRAYPNLRLHSAVVPEARHSSVKPLAYTAGLRDVFYRDAVAVPPAALVPYVGTYRLTMDDGETFDLTTSLVDDQLHIQSQYGEDPDPLYPASPARLFSRRNNREYSFHLDAEGVCTKLTVHEPGEEWEMERLK